MTSPALLPLISAKASYEGEDAPSTMRRMVPLPRFAVEDNAGARGA